MKQTKEFLKTLNISESNPEVQQILSITEKSPHYEFFFIKARFGTEQVNLQEIFSTYNLMRNKNIKVSRSVDQYKKFVVLDEFKTKINTGDGLYKEITIPRGKNLTNKQYKSLPDYLRKCVDERTDFEAFADEIRDLNNIIIANKVFQEFAAPVKGVIDVLSQDERKKLYSGLHEIYVKNVFFLAKKEFSDIVSGSMRKFVVGERIDHDLYEFLTSEGKKNVIIQQEPPYKAFIKKSSRYKSKDELFNSLDAALYSMSGSDEYKLFIKLIEDEDEAFLEGLNPDQGVILASALNARSYGVIGGSKTTHCIAGAHKQSMFNSNVPFGSKQFFMINTSLPPTDINRLIGFTMDSKGNINKAHAKGDENIVSYISSILMDYGVAQYARPLTELDIIEHLYIGINNDSIFTDMHKSNLVIQYLPKLDTTRFDKRKLVKFIVHAHKPEEMQKILTDTFEMNNSEEYKKAFDYVTKNVLNMVSDGAQQANIVKSLMFIYSKKVGICAIDVLNMMEVRSPFAQPSDIIEWNGGEEKFEQYLREYDDIKTLRLLKVAPQTYVNVLKNKEQKYGDSVYVGVIKAIIEYDKRDSIRTLILERIDARGIFAKVVELIPNETLVKVFSDSEKLRAKYQPQLKKKFNFVF